MDFFGHLRTINHHKMLVTKTCFKVGLYKQGILHDLSKYNPVEFIPGVIYFQGDRSPINEYWIDYSINPSGKLVGMKMSKKYVAEMVIDRICASKNYLKEKYTDRSALEYYMNGRQMMLIDEETDFLARYLLTMLSQKGEDYLLDYMKRILLKHKNRDYHVIDGSLVLD